MKFNKILTLILTLVMLLTLAACGDNAAPENLSETPDNGTREEITDTPDNDTDPQPQTASPTSRMQLFVDAYREEGDEIYDTGLIGTYVVIPLECDWSFSVRGNNTLVHTFVPNEFFTSAEFFHPLVMQVEDIYRRLFPFMLDFGIENPVIVVQLVDTDGTVLYEIEFTENTSTVTVPVVTAPNPTATPVLTTTPPPSITTTEPPAVTTTPTVTTTPAVTTTTTMPEPVTLEITIINNLEYDFSFGITLGGGESYGSNQGTGWESAFSPGRFVPAGEKRTFTLNPHNPNRTTVRNPGLFVGNFDAPITDKELSWMRVANCSNVSNVPPGSTITLTGATKYTYTEPGRRTYLALVSISVVGPDGAIIDVPEPQPLPQEDFSPAG